MITKKQDRQTKLTELAETYNLALSLRRINNAPGYSNLRWERALMHAIQISGVCDHYESQTKIREALKLP